MTLMCGWCFLLILLGFFVIHSDGRVFAWKRHNNKMQVEIFGDFRKQKGKKSFVYLFQYIAIPFHRASMCLWSFFIGELKAHICESFIFSSFRLSNGVDPYATTFLRRLFFTQHTIYSHTDSPFHAIHSLWNLSVYSDST